MKHILNLLKAKHAKSCAFSNSFRDRRMRIWKRGLTLVELAIVILVLGVIMGIVYANLNPGESLDKAKKLQIKALSNTLEAHWQSYELDNDVLSEGASLEALCQSSATWRGIKKEQVMDPWKRPYFICSDNSGARQICTYGADGLPGGTGQNSDFYLSDQSSWPSWLRPKK